MTKTNSTTIALREKKIDDTRESVLAAAKYMYLIKEIVVHSDQDDELQLNSLATEGLFFVVTDTIKRIEDVLEKVDDLGDDISNLRQEKEGDNHG